MRDVGPHPYLSALAVRTLAADPPDGWLEVDGTVAFFDVSGFTPLTERLSTVGRAGAEHINDVLNTVFTGLIEDTGQVAAVQRGSDHVELVIRPAAFPAGELAIGESIAVDGDRVPES